MWYNKMQVVLDEDSESIVTIGSKEGLAHLMLAILARRYRSGANQVTLFTFMEP